MHNTGWKFGTESAPAAVHSRRLERIRGHRIPKPCRLPPACPESRRGETPSYEVPTAATAALLNTARPRTWPRGRDRPFQVLDPPWRSLEPGGNAQQAGFWRYRWRTERMAIRYDRPQQGRQTGEDAGGVLECENQQHPRKEHPRFEQEE